jgi:adenylate cyclase
MGTPAIRCPPRTDVLRPLAGETLLDAALRQRIPLASSCGGKAVCGDCVVRIAEGDASFPPPDAEESAWRARKRYDGPLRLACCLRPTGDGAVTTTYW